jgi:hypothetical protein
MSIFNNDKGFFQNNGEGGVKFDLGAGFQNMKRNVMDKPCAGQPGVCPYTCKPLQSQEEIQDGISAEAKAQGKPPESVGQNAITGRNIMATPQAMANPNVQAQLAEKENLINSVGGLGAMSGTGALQGQNAMRMRKMGGFGA